MIAFSTRPGRHLARPAQHRRHAEAAFQRRALAAGERRLAAVRPGEVLGAVVGGEDDDRVVVDAHVLELLHDRRRRCRRAAPCRLPGSTSRSRALRMFSYLSERWVTTCMRVGLSQRKNGLLSFFALSRNLKASVEDLVVDRLHALGIERARIFDPLLADLAPARLHRRRRRRRSPSMDHVARPDLVQERLRVVAMGRILHRVEVIEVAEELVEAVHASAGTR